MGRYDDVADAGEGRFAEPEDEHSWIYFARDGDEITKACLERTRPAIDAAARP